MGYTTEFEGRFLIDPPLDRLEVLDIQDVLSKDMETHWNRAGEVFELHYGPGTPDSWCQWQVSDLGTFVEWDNGEKFYNYIEWLNYLIQKFFLPRGHTLKGVIKFQGEEIGDSGTIEIINDVAVKVTPKNLKNALWDAALHWATLALQEGILEGKNDPGYEESSRLVAEAEKAFKALLEKL